MKFNFKPDWTKYFYAAAWFFQKAAEMGAKII
jgi:hypothetical protein